MLSPKLLNIPYEYGAASYDGCDCWGLIVLAYKQLGITLPDLTQFYSYCPDGAHLNIDIGYRELELIGGLQEVATLAPYTIILGVLPHTFGFGLWLPDSTILRTYKRGRSGVVDWSWAEQYEETKFFYCLESSGNAHSSFAGRLSQQCL